MRAVGWMLRLKRFRQTCRWGGRTPFPCLSPRFLTGAVVFTAPCGMRGRGTPKVRRLLALPLTPHGGGTAWPTNHMLVGTCRPPLAARSRETGRPRAETAAKKTKAGPPARLRGACLSVWLVVASVRLYFMFPVHRNRHCQDIDPYCLFSASCRFCLVFTFFL